MTSIAHIIDRAIAKPKHIVLAEGLDNRIVKGAVKAVADGVANITLLGPEARIRKLTREAGDHTDRVSIIDPGRSNYCDEFADIYYNLRQHKGISQDEARTAVQPPLNFANLLVQAGYADGSVAGAVHTTADVVRSAIQIIGLSPETSLVSSFFIMQAENRSAMLYSDCGLVVSPSVDELVQIARATAKNAKHLLGLTPRVGMLSFATGASATHPDADKVNEATQLLRALVPDLIVGGPVQFDAAIDPETAKRKSPESPLVGGANVFIFPDLNAGNIAYKITERLAGMKAIGPILQGLAKPANDLSRGCDAEAVYNMIAVTAVQADI
ncbi:MAG: phosphate acetyltransferase [Acidimicrobiales bacterium]|nr:phosphate acetyltransferase [Hyphomonadaceae bacterium]RZV44161.1 MAG: phosphate acetyltransferase [Acidimicrobiales bacterium]